MSNDDLRDLESDELEKDEQLSNERPAMSLDPDSILDSIVPSSIDWRDTVSRHPLISVVGVGMVGYLVGRAKGSAIMAGVSAGVSSALTRQLSDVFEGDFFDF